MGKLKIGTDQRRPTTKDLSTLLPMQLFHPESYDLLNHGPPIRRRFLDWGLFYSEPYFMNHWHRFSQALKQRNAALFSKHSLEQIQSWNKEFVHMGEQLSALRSRYVDALIVYAQPWIERLVGKIAISLDYYSGWDTTQRLAIALNHSLGKDRKYGYTYVGPHRFDLLVQSNGFHVREVLSRGEKKRLICALYLAQGQLFKQLTGKSCIYLLDDILSELDHYYQHKVLDALQELDAQLFMTSLDKQSILSLCEVAGHKQFYIEEGKVVS